MCYGLCIFSQYSIYFFVVLHYISSLFFKYISMYVHRIHNLHDLFLKFLLALSSRQILCLNRSVFFSRNERGFEVFLDLSSIKKFEWFLDSFVSSNQINLKSLTVQYVSCRLRLTKIESTVLLSFFLNDIYL